VENGGPAPLFVNFTLAGRSRGREFAGYLKKTSLCGFNGLADLSV
jgi:hypothetical protein